MTILRTLARPLLASVFIYDGLDAVFDSEKHAQRFLEFQPLLEKAGVPPVIASDAELMAKISGTITTIAGCGLAFGIAPRTHATILAALNLPITIVNTFTQATSTLLSNDSSEAQGEESAEPVVATQSKDALHTLFQGMAVAGGLLLAIFDREGKPSLLWQAQATGRLAQRRAEKLARKTSRKAQKTAQQAQKKAAEVLS